MLTRLQRQASRFAGAAKPLLALSALVLAGIGVLLAGPSAAQREIFLIPALLVFVWLLLAFAFIQLFVSVPDLPPAGSGWLKRMSVSIRRGFYYLFAVLMLGVSIAVLVITFQLTMAWIRSYGG